MSLQGKKIAILIAPRGTEDPEFAKPHEAVKQAGATVTVIGLEAGDAETVYNDLDPAGRYKVDRPSKGRRPRTTTGSSSLAAASAPTSSGRARTSWRSSGTSSPRASRSGSSATVPGP